MSSVNNFQIIEKERNGDLPNLFWKSEGCSENDTEDSKVFENCLTGISTNVSAIDLNVENTHSRNENNIHWSGVEEGNDSITTDCPNNLEDNDFCEDVDETDYFDSEDEYWDTFTNKQTDIEPCPQCLVYHIPYGSLHDKYYPYGLKGISTVNIMEAYKFAKENNFKIQDVRGDERCLFRAINDQFMINGCHGHTDMSIRLVAEKQFAKNPKKYPNHTPLNSSEESLENYLRRAKKSGAWCDNVVLQALADAFLLHINVYSFVYNEVKQTHFTANLDKVLSSEMSIFIGHLGEPQSYFSLRPVQWLTELPYKAQIYRMLVTCTDESLEERISILDKKLAMMSQANMPGSFLTDCAQFVLEIISYEGNAKNRESSNLNMIFKSYTDNKLQYEETEDSKNKLVEDETYIDPVSGIPISHLSFIMKNTLASTMFHKCGSFPASLYVCGKIYYHYLGSIANNTRVSLQSILPTNTSVGSYARHICSKSIKIVVLKNSLEALHVNESIERITGPECVIVDSSDTLPGYCRLRLPSNFLLDRVEDVCRLGSNTYLRPFRIPETLYSELEGCWFDKIQCIGVMCQTFPFSLRWTGSKRKHDFPSRVLIDSLIRTGCTLIPKSHPNSAYPDIEWQFNFSMAEHLIFKSLTFVQRHGFYVLKALLDQLVCQITFKSSYLKNIFLMACEEIPCSAWETTFSGCILYVLDALLSCLKSRFLPNFFIPESNLIDCLGENDTNKLIAVVEYIRIFPACVIQIVTEQHGITYAPNLIKRVLLSLSEDCVVTRNRNIVFHDVFFPLTKATARSMAKIGFYQTSFDMLERAFEESLLTPQEGLKQMSVSFHYLFEKTVKEMKQKASRFILSEMFDLRTGSNLSSFFGKTFLPLQSCLEWNVDHRLNWLEVPSESVGDLIAISRLLYECSRKQYWRRNKILAELTITTAIRCIQETLQQNPLKNDETQTAKRMLIQHFIHMFYVSQLDFSTSPIILYLDDIENLCQEFPEMARIVSQIFRYVRQPEKSQQYARMFKSNLHGRSHHSDFTVTWE